MGERVRRSTVSTFIIALESEQDKRDAEVWSGGVLVADEETQEKNKDGMVIEEDKKRREELKNALTRIYVFNALRLRLHC